MKSFIRSRVVKSNAVEVSVPRLVESQTDQFQPLGGHLAVVRNVTELEDGALQMSDSVEVLGENSIEQNAVKLWEVENTPSEVLTKTQAEALELLNRARHEAEELRVKAQTEAEEFKERLREEVTLQAQAEGFQAGFAQGRQEGRSEAEREWQAKKQEAKSLVQLAQRTVAEEFAKADQELLHLAVKIAERILRTSLALNPDLLVQQIRALTLFPQEREGWRLHVSSDDYSWLKEYSLEKELHFTLVSDDTLHSGESFLECNEGIFDAHLETQLARLEQFLREELRHEGLEQAGR